MKKEKRKKDITKEAKKNLSKEEFRKLLPKNLNKAGEWALAHFGDESGLRIYDMKAVLK
jgi:hypothetical protein